MKNLSIIATTLLLALVGCSPQQPAPVADTASSSEAMVSSGHPEDSDQVRAKLIDALLSNRLRVTIVREHGSAHGCEPQEPYYRMKISRHVKEPYMADPDAPDGGHIEVRDEWQETDLGDGISLIESTGVVSVMDVCLE